MLHFCYHFLNWKIVLSRQSCGFMCWNNQHLEVLWMTCQTLQKFLSNLIGIFNFLTLLIHTFKNQIWTLYYSIFWNLFIFDEKFVF